MALRKNKNYKKKIISSFMISGKKHVSEKLIHNIFKNIQSTSKKDFKLIFKLAIKNLVTPISTVTIKKRKYTRIVPFFLQKKKRILYTIKQIGSMNIHSKFIKTNFFFNEILLLANNKGQIKNKLKSLNQLSCINKNFTHFRWFI